MANSTSRFNLRPITASDIQACASVADLAFREDRHSSLKAASKTNPYKHEESMKGGLAHWLSQPTGTLEMTMAVDDTTQQALGWVVWVFRGFNSPEAEAQRESELKRLDIGEDSPRAAQTQTNAAESDRSLSARERLEAHTSEDMSTWMKQLMPLGTRCMFIASLVVHPSHHRKGIGSALVRRGTDRADAESVFCWVHASEAGAPFFAKHGFEETGRLELDLDSWNTEGAVPPEGPEAEWGTYVFRYMRRDQVAR